MGNTDTGKLRTGTAVFEIPVHRYENYRSFPAAEVLAPRGPGGPEEGAGVHRRPLLEGKTSAKNSAKCRSFSAVSAPIFASKYAFCSIFQNLPDYLAEFFEMIWQIIMAQGSRVAILG